jgi:hypothetical protein
MWWIVGWLALLAASAFGVVGAIFEDGGLSLARSWDRVRYSVTFPEQVTGIVVGIFPVVILYVLNGIFRVLTFGVGVSVIITGVLSERVSRMLPWHPKMSERLREVEE